MLIYGIIFPRWRVAADVSLGSWKIFRRFFPSLFRPIIASAGRKCYTAPAIIPLLFLSPSLISFKSSFGHSLGAARTGHRRRNMICLRQVEVCLRCVLRPLVTVEVESTSDLFCLQSLANRVRDKRRSHISADFPRKNNFSAQIQHSTHVQHIV